jgi:hypothetical protein
MPAHSIVARARGGPQTRAGSMLVSAMAWIIDYAGLILWSALGLVFLSSLLEGRL